VSFFLAAIFGVAILLVRRNVPESPWWMVIHGYDKEAEVLVAGIESQVIASTGLELDPPYRTLRIKQRKSTPMREIAGTFFKLYPRRTILCFSLFTGQAFLYNAIFSPTRWC
jgi:hypothetical protein